MRTLCGLLLLFLAALALAPAQARGRDDVMASAYRCGGIADDRQWLDCYYGAAQPVRAALGLPPAPEAQLRLAAAPPANGEARNSEIRGEAMAGAARCYRVVDDRQWLDCYYGAVQPVRALLNLPQTKAPPPAQPAEPPAFAVRKAAPAPPGGFSDWLSGSGNQRIVAHMRSYKFDKYGIFTVTLDNGQVWQQNSGDTVYARWKKPAASYIAILSRGALGSIDLRLQGEPHIFKVSRLE
jgi:hypothetical protein